MKTFSTAIVLLFLGWPGRALAQLANPPRGAASSAGGHVVSAPPPSSGSATSTLSFAGPFLGGVPSGKPCPGVLSLSLAEAVDRGLKFNLGLFLAEEGSRAARGARWRELSALLPDITTKTSETVEQINLRAFGFAGFPGVAPVVGPFSVFDTRAFLSQRVVDWSALQRARAASQELSAANFAARDAREFVVLLSGLLYFRAVAGWSRVEAAEAQLKTAQAIYDRALDMKKAGVIPGIDVVRADVELQAQKQRVIYFRNEFEKQKFDLARAIGLPAGQEFTLTDRIPYTPIPPATLQAALDRAYRSRADYQRALALVRAAEAAKRAARGEGLPSLALNADYGDIGVAPGVSHGTFSVAGTLQIPVFQGGRVRGKVLEADALLRQREAELADLGNRIEVEVRTAFLDLKASNEQVQVARTATDLAQEQVRQSQDRFSAGVANTVEVVQAQEALAAANENLISSLFSYELAAGNLARAVGAAEESYRKYMGGSR